MLTTDQLYGPGRGPADLRGVFTPRGAEVGGERGSVLATFRGFGSQGAGRDKVLDLFERFNMISSEQRAAAGPVAGAAEGAVAAAAEPAAAFAGAGAGTGAATGAVAGGGSIYEQLMQRDLGLAFPATRTESELLAADALQLTDTAPAAAAAASAAPEAAAAEGAIAGAADDAAARIRDLEARLMDGFEQLGKLPAEHQLPILTSAVDATAAAGHGADSFGLLAKALADRPLDASVAALDDALAAGAAKAAASVAPEAAQAASAAAKAAPEVAEVVAHAAPLADDAARVAAAAVPKVVEAAVPKIVEEVAPAIVQAVHSQLATTGLSHGLQGVMGFSAGIDDTMRLLAKVRL